MWQEAPSVKLVFEAFWLPLRQLSAWSLAPTPLAGKSCHGPRGLRQGVTVFSGCSWPPYEVTDLTLTSPEKGLCSQLESDKAGI